MEQASGVMTLQMVVAIILIFFYIFIGLFAYWAYEAVWAVQGDKAETTGCAPCAQPVPAAGSLASVLLAAAALAWVTAALFFIHLFVALSPSAKGRVVGAITLQAIAMLTGLITLILLAYALSRIQCEPLFQKVQGCHRILPQYVTVGLVATVFALVLQIVVMVATVGKVRQHMRAVKGQPKHEHVERVTRTKRIVDDFADGSSRTSESVSTSEEMAEL